MNRAYERAGRVRSYSLLELKYLTGYLRLTVMPVFRQLIPSTECLDDKILHHANRGKS